MINKNPDKPNLIFIVGMPAVGKTYWGSKIAAAHGLEFVDLDVCVAREEGASIQAMFASYGEGGFREREHKYLNKVMRSATDNTIIACGGGTPLFHDNMKLMLGAGAVIYLQADVDYLMENLRESDEARPLLNNRGDLGAYLTILLHKRSKVYEQAQHILPAENISLTTFDQIISSCINRQ